MVEVVQAATVHQTRRTIRRIIQAASHHQAAVISTTAHQVVVITHLAAITVASRLLTIIMVAEVHQAEAVLQKHLNRMMVIM